MLLQKNGNLIIDDSYKEKNKFRKNAYYKFYYYLYARSILFATIAKRLKLLRDHGIKLTVGRDEMSMSTKFKAGKQNRFPDQNDLPSTWPDSLRKHAFKVASLIILKWKKYVEEHGRKFAILYVPRESEFHKDIYLQDSWKLSLVSLCEEHDIPFVDPTEYFEIATEKGKEIYYGHYTKDGHFEFARAFIDWFKGNAKVISMN